MKADKITYVQQILLAADSLEETFSEAKLVEALWIADPKRWGMGELWEKYPNNNAVRICLSGERGLVTRGLLRRVAPLTYQLTDKARKHIKDTRANGKQRLTPIRLPRLESRLIRTQLRSVAFARYCGGMKDNITTTDIIGLWEISWIDPKDFQKKMDKVDKIYGLAFRLMIGDTLSMDGGGELTRDVLTKLQECSNFMKAKVTPLLQRRVKQTS